MHSKLLAAEAIAENGKCITVYDIHRWKGEGYIAITADINYDFCTE